MVVEGEKQEDARTKTKDGFPPKALHAQKKRACIFENVAQEIEDDEEKKRFNRNQHSIHRS
jgi:hypothetical protein